MKAPHNLPLSGVKRQLLNAIPLEWDTFSVTGTNLTVQRLEYAFCSPRVDLQV